MRVLFVTSEVCSLAKTGGLADVSRALPIALKKQDIDVRLLLPGYPSALAQVERPRAIARLAPLLGISDATLVVGRLPTSDVPVFLIDSPSLYRREGGLYLRSDGQEWPDNALRFAFLSHVGAELAMERTCLGWQPDVVHANDWHTGLLPLLLSREGGARPKTVFTVHNMAFQGNFSPEILPAIGVPADCFLSGNIEYYGQASFLKAGLCYGDRLTTVSPTYAKEVITPEFGCGLDGLLRTRSASFSGILNGIDDASWDPASDPYLPHLFRTGDIGGKKICKAELQREFGLPVRADAPLIGFVSRLTHQKMADVILDALPLIVERDAQFVLLGQGNSELEKDFVEAQAKYPGHVAAHIAYDEALAHRLQAGSDILLAPARYEPCGLTQLYALRYGTLPVVRRTGGLADTVVDTSAATIIDRTATGFVFDNANLISLITALDRALACYMEPLIWRRLQAQAMRQDFSWRSSAAQYAAYYNDLAGAPVPRLRYHVPSEDSALQSVRQAAS